MGKVNHENDNLVWNEDPEWFKYTQRFEEDILKIVSKYTLDEALREDCAQEARIELLMTFPRQVNIYEDYMSGLIEEPVWQAQLDRYCRNVIRNTVLSYLASLKTGNWYIGRTKRVVDKDTGKRVKIHIPARYDSLDTLSQESGLQVDEEGMISWDHTAVFDNFVYDYSRPERSPYD
jgi:hypothetical protein